MAGSVDSEGEIAETLTDYMRGEISAQDAFQILYGESLLTDTTHRFEYLTGSVHVDWAAVERETISRFIFCGT